MRTFGIVFFSFGIGMHLIQITLLVIEGIRTYPTEARLRASRPKAGC